MRRYIEQIINHYKPIADHRYEQAKASYESEQAGWEAQSSDTGSKAYDPLEEDEGMEQHFADIEAYLQGPREGIDQPLAYYAEIDLMELPPAKDLQNDEAEALFETLDQLINTYGHGIELYPSEDCPPQILYDYLLQILAKPTRMMSGGFTSHGCGYDPPSCELGKYCSCLAEEWTYEEYIQQGGDPTIERNRFEDTTAVLQRRHEEEEELKRDMNSDWKRDIDGAF